ncbi:hypothetical protein MMC22_010501 [Lobaria immixta]|nr:hypothetical protein [Lobaria immixta]
MLKVVVFLGTVPYYRFFQFNTLGPILRIAKYSSRRGQSRKVSQLLARWRTRKLAELQFISIACAIIAAAVIGSFSWNAAFDAYWVAPALWYSSLVLSIFGLLLSTQQIAVLQLLDADGVHGKPDSTNIDVSRYLPLMVTDKPQHLYPAETQRDGHGIRTLRPRWKMVFAWQCPIMFMSYSVCLYLSGLLIYVCTPLIRGNGWDAGSNVSSGCEPNSPSGTILLTL